MTPTAASALYSATSPALSSHQRGGTGSSSGHSRSVSHDSYFDVITADSMGRMAVGELSELRLNFDLEEPEMRIFSEDESLVSSPKVAAKEVYINFYSNIFKYNKKNDKDEDITSEGFYFKQSGRKIQSRTRTEDNSSATNSPKNPSPKKQPRTVGSPNGSLR